MSQTQNINNIAKIYRLSNPENNQMAFYSFTYGSLENCLKYHNKKLNYWFSKGISNMFTDMVINSTNQELKIELIKTLENEDKYQIYFEILVLTDNDSDFPECFSNVFASRCNCCQKSIKLCNVNRHKKSLSHLINEERFIQAGKIVEIINIPCFYENASALDDTYEIENDDTSDYTSVDDNTSVNENETAEQSEIANDNTSVVIMTHEERLAAAIAAANQARLLAEQAQERLNNLRAQLLQNN